MIQIKITSKKAPYAKPVVAPFIASN